MNEQDDRRTAEISNGALVARMAGSISVAIGMAAGVVGLISDLGPHLSLAIRAVAGVAVSAAVVLAIVRWLNRRLRSLPLR